MNLTKEAHINDEITPSNSAPKDFFFFFFKWFDFFFDIFFFGTHMTIVGFGERFCISSMMLWRDHHIGVVLKILKKKKKKTNNSSCDLQDTSPFCLSLILYKLYIFPPNNITIILWKKEREGTWGCCRLGLLEVKNINFLFDIFFGNGMIKIGENRFIMEDIFKFAIDKTGLFLLSWWMGRK